MSIAFEQERVDVPPSGGVSVRIDAGGGFQQVRGDRIMRSALRAGVAFPYECNAGSCGCCRFELLSGSVDVAWPQAPAWTDRDRRKNRYLGCQTSAVSDCVIRVGNDPRALAGPRPRTFGATLTAKRWVTHDMCELTLQATAPAQFLPGQYAIVSAPGVPARCYSMSNLANEAGVWQFIVRRVPGGLASGATVDAPLGVALSIDGPYGLAHFRPDAPEEVVCIAGGSGLAPMLSIARAADRLGKVVHFFYGGRRPQDMTCLVELGALRGFGTRIQAHSAISAAVDAQDDHWTGERGLLPDLLMRRLGDGLLNYRYYAAGAPGLMGALEELLVARGGLSPERLHFDRFS